jgi:hypothetical protein
LANICCEFVLVHNCLSFFLYHSSSSFISYVISSILLSIYLLRYFPHVWPKVEPKSSIFVVRNFIFWDVKHAYSVFSLTQSFRPLPGVDLASDRNEYQEYFLGGKGGRYVALTTLPPSCVHCLEIWELQPPGTLRACPSLYRDCFTFTFTSTVPYKDRT